jgi:hypothetical protein
MVLTGIALLSLTLLLPCAPSFAYTKAKPLQSTEECMYETTILSSYDDCEITVYEEETTVDTDEGDAAGLDISHLLFLQNFRNSINDAWTPFMEFVSTFATRYLILAVLFIEIVAANTPCFSYGDTAVFVS